MGSAATNNKAPEAPASARMSSAPPGLARLIGNPADIRAAQYLACRHQKKRRYVCIRGGSRPQICASDMGLTTPSRFRPAERSSRIPLTQRGRDIELRLMFTSWGLLERSAADEGRSSHRRSPEEDLSR